MTNITSVLAEVGLSNLPLKRLTLVPGETGWLTCGLEEFERRREALERASQAIGYWPVLIGDDGDLESLVRRMEDGPRRDPAEIIQASEKVHPERWLEETAAADPQAVACEVGQWPADITGSVEFTRVHVLRQEGRAGRVHAVLLPTPRAWEAPAYLGFGGIAGAAAPEVHVSMWRRWHKIYGAELAVVSGMMLEGAVSRPPQDREAAFMLAREQLIYSPKVVFETGENLATLAALLEKGTRWSFWW